MTMNPTRPDDLDTAPPDPTHAEPWFARLARFSGTHRRAVMIIWLVATVAAAPLAITLTGALSGAGWEAQGSTSVEVRDELRRDFPQLGAEAAVVVVHQDEPFAEDPAALEAVVAELDGAPGAASVVDPLAQPAGGGPDLARRAHGDGPGRTGRRRTTRSCPRRPAS